MNNIEELKSAYRDVELTARNMRGKPEEYRVVTGFCPVNVVEMQAQKIQALIAQLEEAQKESKHTISMSLAKCGVFYCLKTDSQKRISLSGVSLCE